MVAHLWWHNDGRCLFALRSKARNVGSTGGRAATGAPLGGRGLQAWAYMVALQPITAGA